MDVSHLSPRRTLAIAGLFVVVMAFNVPSLFARDVQVGDDVVLRSLNTKIDVSGERVHPPKWRRYLPYRVERIDGNRVWIVSSHMVGQKVQGAVARDELIPRSEADGFFTELLDASPNSARLHVTRGLVRLYHGEVMPALDDGNAAVRCDPRDVLSYFFRVTVRFYQKDFDNAIADADSAIRIDPAFSYAYAARGPVRGFQGDHDRAIADLSEAIRLEPACAELFYDRAQMWNTKGDQARAVADLGEAMDDPGHRANTERCAREG